MDELIEFLAGTAGDPYKFVLGAFPWGEAGTELAGQAGPEAWQRDLLVSIRDGLRTPDQALREAIASGHGIGKSALVSWVVLWGVATMADARGVVTANTENQLKTKTWAELAKWFRLFIARSLFKLTATALFSADPEHEKTWRVDMIPWSERNTEAFAGLHNQGRRILVVFDEASNIPDVIWETTEGALTDQGTQILWLVAGNPTRSTGRFRGCFEGPLAHLWHNQRVDSRVISFTNKKQIAEWAESYGEDSDFFRIRVKGEFPRVGTLQFISTDVVRDARTRDVITSPYDPFVIGVDVARFGDDSSVICFRKGRDARSIEWFVGQGLSTMELAAKVAEFYAMYHADALFVDGGGVGGGVVDRLRELRVPVFEVQFGAKPDGVGTDPSEKFANKRAEIYGAMRAWLAGGAIPDDDALELELVGPNYGYNQRDAIQLETKADMKRRGLPSPDRADALAITFAFPVMSSKMAGGETYGRLRPGVEFEYDPFLEAA